MNRGDIAAVVPDFIALAESRIATDVRVRRMLKAATLSIVAGLGVALPPARTGCSSSGIPSIRSNWRMSRVTCGATNACERCRLMPRPWSGCGRSTKRCCRPAN
ncbi:phage adaptor protein [Variovorax paradoxus]|uniref:phage adaptor protein n=1 Tax=Variovorax paradoxus TaxID=34073 RepID=UPI003D7C22DE